MFSIWGYFENDYLGTAKRGQKWSLITRIYSYYGFSHGNKQLCENETAAQSESKQKFAAHHSLPFS